MIDISKIISDLNQEDFTLRIDAIRILAEEKIPEAVDLLIPVLDDEHIEVRKETAWALGQIRDPRAFEPLIAKLKDVSPVAKEVQSILENLGSKVLDPLISSLRCEDAKMRRRIVNTFCKIKDPRGFEYIITALGDKDSEVRLEAAKSLREIKINLSVNALIEALKDNLPDIRSTAADALGQIRDNRAIIPLIEKLKDRNEDSKVRYEARQALGNIGTPTVEDLTKNLADWNSGWDIAILLDKLDWQPKSDEDKIHYWVATKNGKELRENWRITKRVLLNDIFPERNSSIKDIFLRNFKTKNDNKDVEYGVIENALFAFIAIGKEEIIRILIKKLYETSNVIVAKAYLNCGHKKLYEETKRWANQNGYTIEWVQGGRTVSWGSM